MRRVRWTGLTLLAVATASMGLLFRAWSWPAGSRTGLVVGGAALMLALSLALLTRILVIVDRSKELPHTGRAQHDERHLQVRVVQGGRPRR